MGAAEDVEGLPEVRQVRDDALALRTTVRHAVHVEDVVAVGPQVRHDRTPSLAAATGDDDPHAAYSRLPARLDVREARPGPPSGVISRRRRTWTPRHDRGSPSSP